MFNSLSGTITGKRSDTIHLSTGGIEWDIAAPATDIAALPPLGSEARVFTWLYHREDQMRLFGFLDETRRETFLELQKVEGIGPKQALKIMGGIGQLELERALEAGDLARLEAVPGLGKKTAQKMVLALKGKLVRADEVDTAASPHAELVHALVEMGYDKKAALTVLTKAEKELAVELAKCDAAEREKLLFKRAIVQLSGA